MAQNIEEFRNSIPVGDLGIIPLQSCSGLGNMVNEYIVDWRKERESVLHQDDRVKDSYIVNTKCSRFGSGEAKGTILDSIRGKDLYLLVDVTNYSIEYSLCGHMNKMSPDDHYSDLKRIITAAAGKARRINVIMPFLYESRQHKRTSRESLDCAVALQELHALGVENIITFDVHDSNVQNAIPRSSFDNFYPTNIILEKFVSEENLENDNLLAVSPDNGALKRTRFYANMLGCSLGGHFEKHRDLYTVVDGKNPILEHEYIGKDVKDKDIIIVDDMIASGESMLDVARELKKRGAKRIYLLSAYAMFTKGIEVFDEAYKEGLFTKLYSTNLSYISDEAKSRSWLSIADCSLYLAKIIYTFHIGGSVSPILSATSKLLEDFAKK